MLVLRSSCIVNWLLQAIWPGVIKRHGGQVDAKFDMSTLAHISDGYSSGTIDQVCICIHLFIRCHTI